MKNTIKMSLVAALAVAGLSTTASAGGLEEAIKGVTISGKMEVEYDYKKETTNGVNSGLISGNSQDWDYDFDMTVKVPVNDSITATMEVEADHEERIRTGGALSESAGGQNEIQINKSYFTYVNGPATVMVGKQGMAGAPWYDDERANGVVGIYNAGPVAIAAANFTNVNGHAAVANETVSAAAVIAGNIADSGINASLWYADVSNVANSYSFDVNGKVADMVNFDLRHTSTDFDGTVGKVSLTKAVVSADIDMVNVRVGYGMTNNNTDVAFVANTHTVNLEAVNGDNDSAVTFGLEQLNIADLNDADVYLIGAGTKIGALSLNLDYIDGSFGNGANNDFDELFFQADYKMSKNFNIGSHYSVANVGSNTDSDSAAISLEYKF